MDQQLEELVEGKTILLDNSFIHGTRNPGVGFLEKLYDGKWQEITIDNIANALEEVSTINRLAGNGFNLRVIPETMIEIREYQTQLNNHLNYFKPRAQKKLKGNKHQRKIRQTQFSKSQEWCEEGAETFEAYQTLCNDVYKLIRTLNNGHVDETNRNKRLYKRMFKIIDTKSRKRERDKRSFIEYHRTHRMKSHVDLTDKLGTDQHIMTTAYIKACNGHVVILTADKGIPVLLDKTKGAVLYINERSANDKIPIPTGGIYTFGVNFQPYGEPKIPEVTRTFFTETRNKK